MQRIIFFNVEGKAGFTLVELLLTIAILSILASITIIAINPAKQLRDARDADRLSDVYTLLNAIHQYAADNDGAFPSTITSSTTEICRLDDFESCTNLINLSVLTDDEAYLVSLPLDPLCDVEDGYCDQDGIGYRVNITTGGHIHIVAPGAENITIDITR